ncbi:MAG: hypothetical protein HZA02_04620 [Nitrospinae bacterium]|nr:hypothetical protein [Nitrospinota bacterium]
MAIDGLFKEKRGKILEIAARHGARNVRLFGSMARRQRVAGPNAATSLQAGVANAAIRAWL